MKYGTLIFTHNVSVLYQSEAITATKRDALLKEWNKCVKEKEKNRLRLLVQELLLLTGEDNNSELNELLKKVDTY